MHRVFCENIPPAGEFAEIESREKEHLFKVFRASPGDTVELLDGAGVAQISEIVTEQSGIPQEKIKIMEMN